MQSWAKLRQCENYRDFLAAYLEVRNLRPADFARAADCHRGFPTDVISGKRRLTAKSFFSFENALKLPAPAKKLFRLLVVREESDVHPEINREKVEELIQLQRSKTWVRPRKTILTKAPSSLENIMKNTNVAAVFAATGDVQLGATFNEIKNRTQLADHVLHNTLAELTHHGLLTENNGRYISGDLHVHFQGIDKNDVMSSLFRKFCDSARERSEQKWTSESELFLFSNICVHQEQLPALKKALRDVILGFADEAMQSNGDCIVKLTAAMHT